MTKEAEDYIKELEALINLMSEPQRSEWLYKINHIKKELEYKCK